MKKPGSSRGSGRKEVAENMSNMHRIQWFDQQIRAGLYPNSSRLAERFEISRRQAQRDIEYLEVSLRAPLLYVAKHRGYVYEDKAYMLPLLYITEEEQDVLRFLAHRYRQYNYENAAVVQRIAHVLERFAGPPEEVGEHRLPIFSAHPQRMQHWQLLSHAIRERRIVQIRYREGGQEAELPIRPLHFTSNYNSDYITAYCERSCRKRAFRLDGILHMQVTAEKFDLDAIERTEWEDAPLPQRKPYLARIETGRPLDGESWHGYPIRPVHDCIYEIEFYDPDSFMQHLLVAEWERLLSPKWLQAKLRDRCGRIAARLEEQGQ
ncbi:helix-turn-helix transcriptional regulator [Paenibacillus dendritiformis]|uniref:helix-turn-helix transcriptional regulator n=1 Tax=Paenibacillus dendritiformis TaxID=130049 RepID=UPI00364B8BA0